MQASTAVEKIFKQAGWSVEQAKLDMTSSSNLPYEQVLMQSNQAYRVTLDSCSLDVAVFNDKEVFLGCSLLRLTNQMPPDDRQSLVRKASTMVALVNLEHKVKLSLHGDVLCLERVIKLEQGEEPIKVVELFLDDCDFFMQHLKDDKLSSFNNLMAAPDSLSLAHSSGSESSLPSENSSSPVSPAGSLSSEQLSHMSASLQYFMGVSP